MSTTGARIAIAGVGAVTPAGRSVEVMGRFLEDGREVAGAPFATTRRHLPIHGARVPQEHAEASLRLPKLEKYLSWPARLALTAVDEAWTGSGWARAPEDGERVGVYVAAGHTGLDCDEFLYACSAAWSDDATDFGALGGRPLRLVDPYFALRTLTNGPAAFISIQYGARGPSVVLVESSIGAAAALQAAADDLRLGDCDRAVVCACDSLLDPTTVIARERAGRLDGGGVLGEGAAAVVLARTVDRASNAVADLVASEIAGPGVPPMDAVPQLLARLSGLADAPPHGLVVWTVGTPEACAHLDEGVIATPLRAAPRQRKAALGDLGAATPLCWVVLATTLRRPVLVLTHEPDTGTSAVLVAPPEP